MNRNTKTLLLSWAIVLGAVTVVVGGFVSIRYLGGRYACSSRWPDTTTSYRLVAGCLVEVNGKLVPERRVRIMPEDAAQ